MAKQQGDTPRTSGQEQQAGQSGQTGQSSQAQRSDAGSAGAQSTRSRTDQERKRQVAREGGTGAMSGTGRAMQRAGQRSQGTALAGRGQGQQMQGQQGQGQPMLLPAFMANPGLMASAFMTNPMGFTQAMSQEMDRLFSSFGSEEVGSTFGQAGTGVGRGSMTSGAPQSDRGSAQFTPAIEVIQRGDDIVILADLPGLDADEVDIIIDDGVLTLSGDRQQSSEGSSYGSERNYGRFSRSIALPEGTDADQVQASFDNGVLEIVVAVPEERERGRHVPIQAGARQSSSGQRQSSASAGAGQSSGRQESGGSTSQSSR